MSLKKAISLMVAAAIVLIAAGFGIGFYLARYAVVDAVFYPREADFLELNGQDISIAHYEKLREALPYTAIAWDIPIGENRYPNDSLLIQVEHLTDEDLDRFAYFTRLMKVDATKCIDYAQLQALQLAYPDLEVLYQVHLRDTVWNTDTTRLVVPALTGEELTRLQYLPNVTEVVCVSGDGTELYNYCQKKGISFAVQIGDKVLYPYSVAAYLPGLTEEQVPLLKLLTYIQNVHITEPEASAASLVALRDAMPYTLLTWDKEVCGVVCTSDDKQVDLSTAESVNFSEVAELMDYFPDTNTVFLGNCKISNEEMAEYRENMRPHFDLVWNLTVAGRIRLRSDITAFIPYEHGVYFMSGKDAENLRYCENLTYMDLSRLNMDNLDFVKDLPNLTYLDLANSQVRDISALSACKSLKFLELDSNPMKDLSPLAECTALEDLNLSSTYADFAPIEKMTWLKNLWVINCNHGVAAQLSEALPSTHVQSVGYGNKENGWKELPNYLEVEHLRSIY